MLVLSRQRDETIMIGDDIEITIVDIRGDKVRVGINAPKEISVHRKEVYDAIQQENRRAAMIKPEDISDVVVDPECSGAQTSKAPLPWADISRIFSRKSSEKPAPSGVSMSMLIFLARMVSRSTPPANGVLSTIR